MRENDGQESAGRCGTLPLLPEADPPVDDHVEIACDESGFSGGNLIGEHNRVFAHASVRLPRAVADALVEELRERTGAPTGEYKAGRLLRSQYRPVLLWLLGPTSPIHGQARIHLTDTRFFVVARLLDVLLGQGQVAGTDCPGASSASRAMAIALHRGGEQSYGSRQWLTFLTLAADLMRTNNRSLPRNPVEAFFAALDTMLQERDATEVSEPLIRLRMTRPAAEAVRAEHLQSPRPTPLLEPLIPALTRSIQSWGSVAGTILVVHDEQSALTPGRIVDIASAVAAGAPGRRLAEVRLVDSRIDSRVQVADFVAGIARRVASDSLHGAADLELTALVRPLVDPESVWPCECSLTGC